VRKSHAPPFGSMADTHPGVRDLVQLDASPRGDVLHGKQILSSRGSFIIQKDGLGGGAATASVPTVEGPTPPSPETPVDRHACRPAWVGLINRATLGQMASHRKK
jgi:hypothetical protein